MNDIKLNFISDSEDRNNSEVVIFKKNEVGDFDDLAVAWKVIKCFVKGWNHPFLFYNEMMIAALDENGNLMGTSLIAEHGQLYSANIVAKGYQLKHEGKGSGNSEILFRNNFERGSVNAEIHRGGKCVGIKYNIVPCQTSAFQFMPKLWIGVTSQIQEGDILNSAILSQIDRELDLTGIDYADIIMTGGGQGPNSTPNQFNLQNIVYL